jgi:hypothetical protein
MRELIGKMNALDTTTKAKRAKKKSGLFILAIYATNKSTI